MPYFFSIFFFLLIIISSCRQVSIKDGIKDEGQECFVIETPSATYYYQKAGGGFSSIVDPEGNDWISFNEDDSESYPESAATSYRGMPNLVFRSNDNGAGHPGFHKCESVLTGRNKITTSSKSGQWTWTWTFHPDRSVLTIEQADPDHQYWFLYEGTPGGQFEPTAQYWGTDQKGPVRTQPDYYKQEEIYGKWRWIYFGYEKSDRILAIVQKEEDELIDTFSYLGNTERGISSPDGMVVAGFGRAPEAQPLLTGVNREFVVGFIEQKIENEMDHNKTDKIIRSWIE